MYVCICVSMCMSLGVPQRPEEAPDPLELALQEVMSCLMWLLGTEPRCSKREVCAHNS